MKKESFGENFVKFCLFVILAFLSANPHQQWEKKSVLHAEKSVELPPGIILPPGDYVFKLKDIAGRRFFVEVWDKSEEKMISDFAALLDHRKVDSISDAIFTYHKIEDEKVLVVRSWYYPGEMHGFEFVYGKKRAREIVKISGEYVLASDNKYSEIVAVLPNDAEISLENAIEK